MNVSASFMAEVFKPNAKKRASQQPLSCTNKDKQRNQSFNFGDGDSLSMDEDEGRKMSLTLIQEDNSEYKSEVN